MRTPRPYIHARMGIRGFTLLEILAATTMFAVLAGALYASMYVAFKARRTALSATENVRKCNQSMELIKADLLSAVVPGGVLGGTFTGQSGGGLFGTGYDDLVFNSAAMDIDPDVGIGDIKKIEYTCDVSTGSTGTSLVRRVTTNLLALQTPEPQQEIICRGIRGFTMRYFDGSVWQDNWDSSAMSNTLPVAVEVTIELQGDSGKNGPLARQMMLLPCGRTSAAAGTTSSGGGS